MTSRRTELRRLTQSRLRYSLTFVLLACATAMFAWRAVWIWFGIATWPMASFVLVALAYGLNDPWWMGKRSDGSLHLFHRIALFPYHTCIRWIWIVHVALSTEPAYDEVNEYLIVARRLVRSELPDNVARICDLTSEFSEPFAICHAAEYVSFPILDGSVPSIDALLAAVDQWKPSTEGRILIHCAMGHGRTGLVAATWLVVHGYAPSTTKALEMLVAVRPGIALHDCQLEFLSQVDQSIDSVPALDDPNIGMMRVDGKDTNGGGPQNEMFGQ